VSYLSCAVVVVAAAAGAVSEQYCVVVCNSIISDVHSVLYTVPKWHSLQFIEHTYSLFIHLWTLLLVSMAENWSFLLVLV
jgi:hypothetical protein